MKQMAKSHRLDDMLRCLNNEQPVGVVEDVKPEENVSPLDARIPALKDEREFSGNEKERDERQSRYLSQVAKEAKTRKIIHDVHTELSISFMRIRYAWCIFVLLVFWLTINLSIIVAHAIHFWNPHYAFVLLWGFGGYFIGGLLGCYVRGCQCIKGIRALYSNSVRNSGDRVEREEEFIRLRLERGVSDPLLLVVCTFVSMLMAHLCLPKYPSIPFSLEPSVMLATITSTTASVIGLFLIVLHWLFPKN